MGLIHQKSGYSSSSFSSSAPVPPEDYYVFVANARAQISQLPFTLAPPSRSSSPIDVTVVENGHILPPTSSSGRVYSHVQRIIRDSSAGRYIGDTLPLLCTRRGPFERGWSKIETKVVMGDGTEEGEIVFEMPETEEEWEDMERRLGQMCKVDEWRRSIQIINTDEDDKEDDVTMLPPPTLPPPLTSVTPVLSRVVPPSIPNELERPVADLVTADREASPHQNALLPDPDFSFDPASIAAWDDSFPPPNIIGSVDVQLSPFSQSHPISFSQDAIRTSTPRRLLKKGVHTEVAASVTLRASSDPPLAPDQPVTGAAPAPDASFTASLRTPRRSSQPRNLISAQAAFSTPVSPERPGRKMRAITSMIVINETAPILNYLVDLDKNRKLLSPAQLPPPSLPLSPNPSPLTQPNRSHPKLKRPREDEPNSPLLGVGMRSGLKRFKTMPSSPTPPERNGAGKSPPLSLPDGIASKLSIQPMLGRHHSDPQVVTPEVTIENPVDVDEDDIVIDVEGPDELMEAPLSHSRSKEPLEIVGNRTEDAVSADAGTAPASGSGACASNHYSTWAAETGNRPRESFDSKSAMEEIPVASLSQGEMVQPFIPIFPHTPTNRSLVDGDDLGEALPTRRTSDATINPPPPTSSSFAQVPLPSTPVRRPQKDGDRMRPITPHGLPTLQEVLASAEKKRKDRARARKLARILMASQGGAHGDGLPSSSQPSQPPGAPEIIDLTIDDVHPTPKPTSLDHHSARALSPQPIPLEPAHSVSLDIIAQPDPPDPTPPASTPPISAQPTLLHQFAALCPSLSLSASTSIPAAVAPTVPSANLRRLASLAQSTQPSRQASAATNNLSRQSSVSFANGLNYNSQFDIDDKVEKIMGVLEADVWDLDAEVQQKQVERAEYDTLEEITKSGGEGDENEGGELNATALDEGSAQLNGTAEDVKAVEIQLSTPIAVSME